MVQKCIMGGGGNSTPQPIDYSYLPNSTKANVLASKNLKAVFEDSNINLVSSAPNTNEKAYVQLSGNNTDVTCYTYGKHLNTDNATRVIMGCPYTATAGNSPDFYCGQNTYQVQYSVYSGDTVVSGVLSNVEHLYAMSINNTTKKVRFFVDGDYKGELSFNNSGSQVVFGKYFVANDTYSGGNYTMDYIGVVAECESDATIIANMQAIMSKMS